MSVDQNKLNTVFCEALARTVTEDRESYLDTACGQDQELRRQVNSLLIAHAQAGGFLRQNAMAFSGSPIGLEPGAVIGRYKLVEKLGEGGCGVVYVAEQTEPVRRRVALKVIKLGMDTKSVVARFEAERQALAMMDHPNIAKVHDAGATDTGRPYFVMELVKGIPITQHCDQNNLPTEERLRLFIRVCQAIQHAHQKGIIHRDIKPSNVLVSVHEGVAVPKVIDFGIAKATQERLTDKTVFTQLHQFMGTPAYMSPEQAEMTTLDIDTRSDIYSLGVLLYELLVGRTPFDARELFQSGLDEMRRIIREREPVRPSTRLGLLPEQERTTSANRRAAQAGKLISLLRGDLDWIVMKCLEKDRTRRYDTASALAAELMRFVANEPVEARPPSTAYKLRKAWQRNRLALTAAALVALAMALGLAVASAGWHQARKQRARAEFQAYAANIRLVQSAWEQNEDGRARQLLEETSLYADRGFEWKYWQRQMHLELSTLRGHTGAVNAVAFSPDSRRIVTGGSDHMARVWDVASGEQLLQLVGHTASILSVAFSPDGRRILTGSYDCTARLWDAASGRELRTLNGHIKGVGAVAFSPDGRLAFTGSLNSRAWDVETGRALYNIEGHEGSVTSFGFSADGQRIVAGFWYSGVASIRELTGRKELVSIKYNGPHVDALACAPDGQRIVIGGDLTSGWTGTAYVYDGATGRALFTLDGPTIGFHSLAYSPDGGQIVGGLEDRTAKVWDASSGKLLFALRGHSEAVSSVAFSPDGRKIATGSRDETAKIWDASGGSQTRTLQGHTNGLCSVAISGDGKRILTGSGDGTARVWDAGTGSGLLTLAPGTNVTELPVAFSPDGQKLVTGAADNTGRIYETSSGKVLRVLRGHSDRISSVAFSPEGRRVATVAFDKDPTARLWDATTGQELLKLRGHTRTIMGVDFSPDGQRIATASLDFTARVWDARNGNLLRTLAGHHSWVVGVCFSPDGKRIGTCAGDREVKIWDAWSGEVLFTLEGLSNQVWAVAFFPDGRRLLTGGADGEFKVWETGAGKELLTVHAHTLESSGVVPSIRSVAIARDGQWFVTGSWDKTAKVWQAATAREASAWEEEREAKKHLTSRRAQEQAEAARLSTALQNDPGAPKKWLVMEPIPFKMQTDDAPVQTLDQDLVPHESELRVREGEYTTVSGKEYVWRAIEVPSGILDMQAENPGDYSAGYAVCYIHSQVDLSRVQIKVGSERQSKVYLNGKAIYRYPLGREYKIDQDLVRDLQLKAGVNTLLFKAIFRDGESGPRYSIHLTDTAGEPLKGIVVSLTP